jgi:hypothetical protein
MRTLRLAAERLRAQPSKLIAETPRSDEGPPATAPTAKYSDDVHRFSYVVLSVGFLGRLFGR